MTVPARATSFPRFEASLHRCLAQPAFITRFYERFVAAHPEIAERFARTDLAKQERVMRASLYLVLRAAAGHDDGLAHLDEIGRTHTSRNLGIRAHHFDVWLETLLGVARDVDPSFDAATEGAWRENLAPCIAAILRTATASEG